MSTTPPRPPYKIRERERQREREKERNIRTMEMYGVKTTSKKLKINRVGFQSLNRRLNFFLDGPVIAH